MITRTWPYPEYFVYLLRNQSISSFEMSDPTKFGFLAEEKRFLKVKKNVKVYMKYRLKNVV